MILLFFASWLHIPGITEQSVFLFFNYRPTDCTKMACHQSTMLKINQPWPKVYKNFTVINPHMTLDVRLSLCFTWDVRLAHLGALLFLLGPARTIGRQGEQISQWGAHLRSLRARVAIWRCNLNLECWNKNLHEDTCKPLVTWHINLTPKFEKKNIIMR